MKITPEFHKIVAEERAKPFCWGINDCAVFVANIYRRYVGIDPAIDVRGTYTNEYDGMRTIVKLGGWHTILTNRGFSEVNKNYVSRGDVVVSNNTLGIWVGCNRAVFAGGATRELNAIDMVFRMKQSTTLGG